MSYSVSFFTPRPPSSLSRARLRSSVPRLLAGTPLSLSLPLCSARLSRRRRGPGRGGRSSAGWRPWGEAGAPTHRERRPRRRSSGGPRRPELQPRDLPPTSSLPRGGSPPPCRRPPPLPPTPPLGGREDATVARLVAARAPPRPASPPPPRTPRVHSAAARRCRSREHEPRSARAARAAAAASELLLRPWPLVRFTIRQTV